MILMYIIIQELIGIDLSIFTFRSSDTFPTTRGHQYKIFKHPVHYNIIEPTFLPAELPTSGMIYHQKLLKFHH